MEVTKEGCTEVGGHGQNKERSSEKMELFLDTNGTCFLCHRQHDNRSNHKGGSVEENRTKKVCLRKICRYLNMKPDKYDYSVELCENCASVCDSLSELVHQLETTNLMIHHRLYRFNQIITEAEENLDGEEGIPMQGQTQIMVKGLRYTVKNKSTVKLKEMMNNSFPKVNLNRITSATTNVQKPLSTLSSRDSSPNPDSNRTNSPQEWISETFQKLVPNRHRYPCPFCKILVPEQIIRSHLLLGHSEKYFVQQLRADVPVDNVKRICRQHLLMEVNTAKKGKSNFKCQHCNLKFNNEVRFKCHYLLNHFVILEEKLFHLDWGVTVARVSEAEVTSSSRNPSKTANPKVADILAKYCKDVIKTKGVYKRFRCLLCKDSRLDARCLINQHLVFVHSEIVFPNYKLEKTTDEDFRTCCKFLLDKESNNSLKTPGKNYDYFSCSFCDVKYPQRNMLRFHLVMKHYKNLGERLISLQENAQPLRLNRKREGFHGPKSNNQEINVKRMKSSDDQDQREVSTPPQETANKSSEQEETSSHKPLLKSSAEKQRFKEFCKKFIKISESGQHANCGVCNISYRPQNLVSLRRHLVNSHAEVFFSQEKLKFENVPEQTYKVYCRKFLREETKTSQQKLKSAMSRTKLPTYPSQLNSHLCKYCKHVRGDGNDFRLHLMTEHHTVLKNKLLQFVEGRLKDKIPIPDINQSQDPLEVDKSKLEDGRQFYDISSKFILTKKSKSGKIYHCAICNYSQRSCKLRPHLANSHPEKFFAKEKPRNLPEEVFKGYCLKFVVQEAKKAQENAESLGMSASSVDHVCTICSQKIRSGFECRYHLVSYHYRILKEKLVKFINSQQEDNTSFEKNQEIIEFDGFEDNNHSSGNEEDGHGDGDNPSVPEIKDIILSSPSMAMAIPSTSNEISSSATAHAQEDYKEKQNVYEICWTLTKKSESGKQYQCINCNFSFSEVGKLRRHIVNCRPGKFFSREKLQQNISEDLFTEHCKNFMYQLTKDSRILSKPRSGAMNLSCEICNRKFSGGHDFRYHQILEHGRILEENVLKFVNEQKNENGTDTVMKGGQGQDEGATSTDTDPSGENGDDPEPAINYETESLEITENNLLEASPDYLVKVEVSATEEQDADDFGNDNEACVDMMLCDDEPVINGQDDTGTETEADTKLAIKSVVTVSEPESILPDV